MTDESANYLTVHTARLVHCITGVGTVELRYASPPRRAPTALDRPGGLGAVPSSYLSWSSTHTLRYWHFIYLQLQIGRLIS
jgi:hypothetical protein